MLRRHRPVTLKEGCKSESIRSGQEDDENEGCTAPAGVKIATSSAQAKPGELEVISSASNSLAAPFLFRLLGDAKRMVDGEMVGNLALCWVLGYLVLEVFSWRGDWRGERSRDSERWLGRRN
jgi:hypothetical protein